LKSILKKGLSKPEFTYEEKEIKLRLNEIKIDAPEAY